VLSILIWWAVPVAAALLAAIVIAITRRVRSARGDMETMERYRRAREVLARGSGDAVDGRATGTVTARPVSTVAASVRGGRARQE
jgi:hypothetical protein